MIVATRHLREKVAHSAPIHGLTIQEVHHVGVSNGPFVFVKERALGEADGTIITPETTVGFLIAHDEHWFRIEVGGQL